MSGIKGSYLVRLRKLPDVDDTVLYDGQVADRAMTHLDRFSETADTPFFLAVGFIKPHTPHIAPKKYWDLYDRDKITIAEHQQRPSFEDLPAPYNKRLHDSSEKRRYTDQPKKGPFSEENQIENLHGYYACVSYIDAQIGKVLDKLDSTGLAADTIVVLWSDHGYHLGEKGLWGKTTNFELDARVPLIVRAPGRAGNTSESKALVELVDLYPTLVDLAGFDLPEHLQGSSFVPVLDNPNRPWKMAAFTQSTRGKLRGYSETDGTRRYTEWVDTSEPSLSLGGPIEVREHYDHAVDPHELGVPAIDWDKVPTPSAITNQWPIVKNPHRSRVRGDGWHIVKRRLDAFPFQLAREFGSHMVVQRDQPFTIHGIAEPGAQVSANFLGRDGSTLAGDDGRWEIGLGKFPANRSPQSLKIAAQTITVEQPIEVVCEDVLVGDVWLCTGQSNMRWRLNQTDEAEAAIAAANHANLRLLDYEARLYPNNESYSLQELRSASAENFYSTTGWKRCTSESAGSFSAVAYFFGERLQRELDVPIGLIHTAVGGVPMESFLPGGVLDGGLRSSYLYHAWLKDPSIPPWCVDRATRNLEEWLKSPDYPTPHHPFEPGFLVAAGARPTNVKGTIWYQGESNATTYGAGSPAINADRSKSLFMSLCGAGTRRPVKLFFSPETKPFYFVQLPGLNRDWAPFREMQRQVNLEMPNSGMAVTIDLGHPTDVHPRNKRPVGERLALQALKKTYGKDLVADGPTLLGAETIDGAIEVKFDDVGSGLVTLDGDAPRGFWVAGDDRVFHPASASIEGNVVLVRSGDVSKPVALRYGWEDDPQCNLSNREGLPASPFRWNDWPDEPNKPEPEDHWRLYETSFEWTPGQVTPEGVVTSNSHLGDWTTPGLGHAEITGKFAKTGERCLHILGGADRFVHLNFPAKAGGILSFAAERWTRREPFRFRVLAEVEGEWREIYHGDEKVVVGARFLSQVDAVVPPQTTRLRFDSTSPTSSGVLIDDLELRLPEEADLMEVGNIEMHPVVNPVLLRKRNNPVLAFSISATGIADPATIVGVNIEFEGTTNLGDIAAVRIFASGGFTAYSESDRKIPDFDLSWHKSKASIQAIDQLGNGKNHYWVSVELNPDASQDHVISAKLVSVELLEKPALIPPDHQPTVQRIGYALRLADEDDCHTYRIPGLATTNKGTLIAVYDNRYRSGGDLPGDIDVGMSRSTDGGRSWEPMKVIMDMGSDPDWSYDGVGDPAVLVDAVTGTIWVAATWSHGERSWHGSGPGMTADETGQLMLTRSDDDGLTWSEPINITAQVKDPDWRFVLQGPGNGITMKNGTLVFAAQFRGPKAEPVNGKPFSTILYSKDRGDTWSIGSGVKIDTTEAQVVELNDGSLMLNCRDNRGRSRSVYTSSDLGRTWTVHPTSRDALPEPVCMASLIRLQHANLGQLLLFSNPATTKGRFNMTLKASDDEGATWPKKWHTLYDSRPGAGYSCLTQIDKDYVGVLYEGVRELYFLRFPIEELINRPGP